MGAALAGTACLIPTVAACATVGAYLLAPTGDTPWWAYFMHTYTFLVGILVAAVVWLVLAWLFKPYTTVSRASARTYQELCTRADQLAMRIASIPPARQQTAAYMEAQRHLLFIRGELGLSEPAADEASARKEPRGNNLRWVFATGYVDLWGRIHRAEECLLMLESPERVLLSVLWDRLRLAGSEIPDRVNLLTLQERAMHCLQPLSSPYLDVLRSQDPGREHVSSSPVVSNSTTTPRPLPAAPACLQEASVEEKREEEYLARSTLRVARVAINEYRDTRRDGLVRIRNQILGNMALTGLMLYVLVTLATISGAPSAAVSGAASYFLIGACIGVFSRLRAAIRSDHAVEDFHLAMVRLLSRPMVSGLAAIGGVAIARMVPIEVNSIVLVPKSDGPLPSLVQTFNYHEFPFGLALAALFGLTPELLFKQLNKLTEIYQADLKKTEPSESAPRV